MPSDNNVLQPKSYAILHKQICDNYSQCPAKNACENKSSIAGTSPAIYITSDNKIDIKKEYCIACESCIKYCGLFRIVSSPYDERRFLKEFQDDPRNNLDYTVERFGCDIIDKVTYGLDNLVEVMNFITNTVASKINILEFVDESHFMCPFQGIDVNFILSQFSCLEKYKKFVIKADDIKTFKFIKEKFNIATFPAILLIKDGKVLSNAITTEYRINFEVQRIKMQSALHRDFAERMEVK